LPVGHKAKVVAAHSLLATGFAAAGVWSSTTALMIATQLLFNQPSSALSSHIALAVLHATTLLSRPCWYISPRLAWAMVPAA
jgi:hypothetical protein